MQLCEANGLMGNGVGQVRHLILQSGDAGAGLVPLAQGGSLLFL
jgi:hypothetical protein